MIKSNQIERIDEISKYYESAKYLDSTITALFWITAILSLLVLCGSNTVTPFQGLIKTAYIILVIGLFLTNIILGLYLIPLAERKRRRQMLSDAFGTPLIQEKTRLYYNNDFSPSISRLGANVMENSLFSKEVASHMLLPTRWIVGTYLLVWLIIFAIRQSDLDVLLTVTQIVFSGAIVVRWLQLEFLRYRHDQTYEALYNHFLSGHGQSPKTVATILDAFAYYETTKASSGIILSSKVFHKINEELTSKWQNIRAELKIHD
jgi:hypothetical protein